MIKNKKWFLITDDYTSLYLQYIYMVFKIYKCFYKNRYTLSNERLLCDRAYGVNKSVWNSNSGRLSRKQKLSALQNTPSQAAKNHGSFNYPFLTNISEGDWGRKQAEKNTFGLIRVILGELNIKLLFDFKTFDAAVIFVQKQYFL